ncbi:hypothetical protein KSP39_PZI004785 [Platanthera zijinensis]|uniref:Uncharacterized protein n=1 Tax=Platanthera zijinensis TaxID=2320716 RepID=A0AAP0BVX1_9ASPA
MTGGINNLRCTHSLNPLEFCDFLVSEGSASGNHCLSSEVEVHPEEVEELSFPPFEVQIYFIQTLAAKTLSLEKTDCVLTPRQCERCGRRGEFSDTRRTRSAVRGIEGTRIFNTIATCVGRPFRPDMIKWPWKKNSLWMDFDRYELESQSCEVWESHRL